MTHLLSLAPQKLKIIISNLNLITVINAEKFTILKTLKVELMEIYIQTFRKRQKSYYVFFEAISVQSSETHNLGGYEIWAEWLIKKLHVEVHISNMINAWSPISTKSYVSLVSMQNQKVWKIIVWFPSTHQEYQGFNKNVIF